MDATSTSISPISTITDTMRTEAEFLEQAELARSALQQFIAVKDFDNADETKRSALNKVIKNTVRFYFSSVFHLVKLLLAPF